MESFGVLERVLAGRARRYLPEHAVEEIVDSALVGAFLHLLGPGETRSLHAVALGILSHLIADWHRRRARRPEKVPLLDDETLAADALDRCPSDAQALRAHFEAIYFRLAPLLAPRQAKLAELVVTRQVRSLTEARRRMRLSYKEFREVLLGLAKKVRRFSQNPPPPND